MSDIETEDHLTPRGWEAGTLPADRVETWTRRIFDEPPYLKEEIVWQCEWAAPDVARAERDALRAKHAEFMET